MDWGGGIGSGFAAPITGASLFSGGGGGGNPISNGLNSIGNFGTGLANKVGLGNQKETGDTAAMNATGQAQYQASEGVLSGMKKADQTSEASSASNAGLLEGQSQGNEISWQAQNDALANQAAQQASDARATYTNDIQPQQKALMEQSGKNAAQAMSLSEAEDPNNQVASGVRNMYNAQGQAAQNQGVADYGVLAALGSQATAGTIGQGNPMTGGQLAAIQGQNMGAASNAYNNAANYAQGLRTQGIQAGINQSNTMYGAGQNAVGMAGQMAAEYQQGNNAFNQEQANLRGEQTGYNDADLSAQQGLAQQTYGLRQGLNQQQHADIATESGNELSALGQEYGTTLASQGAQLSSDSAQGAANLGFFTNGINQVAKMAGGSGGAGPNYTPGNQAASVASTNYNAGQGAGIGAQMAAQGYSQEGPYAAGYGTADTGPNIGSYFSGY